MDFKIVEMFGLLMLNCIHSAYTENILSCNVTRFNSCPKNQICMQKSHECECLEGYARSGSECVAQQKAPSGDRDATAAVVSIFTIALVAVGLALVIRKYNLVEYARQKINLRKNNDVIYEDVMIGQDDPPLVP